jgi:hypothetical protein
MKTLLSTFTLFLITVCNGLAQTNTAVPAAGSAPTHLAILIASADHIIVTNRFAGGVAAYRGFSLTISGGEARKIIAHVSGVGPSPVMTDSIFDWELRFYRGGDYLATIYLAHSTFMFGGQEYVGGAELEALSDRLLKLTTPPQDR